MITIKATNANDLFIKLCKKLLEEGEEVSPRGLKTLELQNVFLKLSDPMHATCTLKERRIDMNYLNAEFEWYKQGSLDPSYISEYSSFWNKLQDSNKTINSNYGFLAFKQKWAGKSQVEWCIERLKEDKYTRQAVINYNQPVHKYNGNKDFVCTLNQIFRINDGKLDIIVLMRSNDIIYGLTYDMPWFIYVGAYIADELGLQIGNYYHYSHSLHTYEKHFDMVKNIANAKEEKYDR